MENRLVNGVVPEEQPVFGRQSCSWVVERARQSSIEEGPTHNVCLLAVELPI